jgi:hypothetical protein
MYDTPACSPYRLGKALGCGLAESAARLDPNGACLGSKLLQPRRRFRPDHRHGVDGLYGRHVNLCLRYERVNRCQRKGDGGLS